MLRRMCGAVIATFFISIFLSFTPLWAQVDEAVPTPPDRKAQPLVRIPPSMPTKEFGGSCEVKMDITVKGQADNIRLVYCTDPIFQHSTIKSVSRWKFSPAIKDGIAVREFVRKHKRCAAPLLANAHLWKRRYTPLTIEGENVSSGPYRTVIWTRNKGNRTYYGSSTDIINYCPASAEG